ncbi:MAG: efflux RND transporter periplasmic adaptor subunit [Methylohalobius sp.]
MRDAVIGLLVIVAEALAQEVTVPMEPVQIERLGIKLVQPESIREISLGFVPAIVTVPAQAEALVSAPVAGRIEELRVARGEMVVAHQSVARLNSPELLAVQQRLLDAQQEFKVAKASYLREKSLFQDGVIAKSRFLKTEKLFRQAQVAMAQARAELVALGMPEAAIERLVKTRKLNGHLELLAPAAGVVTAREVTVGQWVDKLAPMLRLTDISEVWLEMAVPAALAERLRPGTAVRTEFGGATGAVTLIGGTVDPATQTVLVWAKLAEQHKLRPGRKVTVELFETVSDPLLKIPRSALFDHQGEQFVFVRVPEGFQVQRVNAAAQTQDAAYLVGGIEATSQVVSQGTAALKAAWLGGEEE